jgi:hypothetical protein
LKDENIETVPVSVNVSVSVIAKYHELEQGADVRLLGKVGVLCH